MRMNKNGVAQLERACRILSCIASGVMDEFQFALGVTKCFSGTHLVQGMFHKGEAGERSAA
jgi:hypothetical protein